MDMNEENKELIEHTEQGNDDKLIDIQNRMNSMEVGKRKKLMFLFIAVFIAILFFKVMIAMKGCSSDREQQTEQTGATEMKDSIAMMQEILEMPLVTDERKRDQHLEEYMDKLVEENRKETGNGKKQD